MKVFLLFNSWRITILQDMQKKMRNVLFTFQEQMPVMSIIKNHRIKKQCRALVFGYPYRNNRHNNLIFVT